MTKENIKAFEITARTIFEKQGATGFNAFIENFFDANVCIPKGENRHLYADVWHSFAEGFTIQGKLNSETYWVDIPIDAYAEFEYRIKPSETVYEWQWLYYSKIEGKAFLTPNFYNEHEAKKELQEGHTKIEETKRVRQ